MSVHGRRLLVLLSGILVGASGCVTTNSQMYADAAEGVPARAGLPAEAPPPPAAAAPKSAGQAEGRNADGDDLARAESPAQRMIIYSASIGMAVADVEAAVQSTQQLAEKLQGYMVTMTGNSITVRVPAKQFFALVERLKALGQTLTKNINAQDITDEYVDLQLRLKNAEALRDRLVTILQKADSVKDTLEVERELNRVRGDIERMKGRLAQLDKQIAFSTVEVTFSQAQTTQARIRRPATPFPWLDRLGVETVLGIGGPG